MLGSLGPEPQEKAYGSGGRGEGGQGAAPIPERRFAGAEVGELEEPAGLDLLRLGADKSRLRSSIPAPAAAAHPL